MNRTIAICIGLASLLAVSKERTLHAEETESFKIPAGPDAIVLTQLAVEYERLSKISFEAIKTTAGGLDDGAKRADEALSDEEWLAAVRNLYSSSVDPDDAMLSRFLEYAKSRPDSPYAFDALFLVISRGGPQTGDVHGKPWQLKEESLDLVREYHGDDLRLFIILEQLGSALPSHKTEAFLKQILNEGRTKDVQAAAAYNLARYYRTLARAHQRSQRIKQKEHLLNFERFWKLVITPYLETRFPLDEEQNSAEIDRLLRLVAGKYSDVPAADWKLSGPAKVFVEITPYPKAKSYGDLSRALSFEMNNIVPGKIAPEIEGTDAEGTSFRLSDYKGKVVVLVFSADWCGSCVALHPLQRKLVEKYSGRPFVMLGVNRDVKVDTLKTDTVSGEITWRCWWDGMHGPIREAWNVDGIPRIILLDDKHKFQNVAYDRLTTQEEFEKTIEALLKNVEPASTSAP